MKKLASTIAAAFLVSILAVGLTATGAAEEESEDATVDVEIDGVTQVDVRPTELSYTEGESDEGVAPGETVDRDDNDFEHIEVENIGSERVGTVWAEATIHNEDPFGTFSEGEEDPQHNTGNFVTLGLETAQSYDLDALSDVDEMHYVNRVEYFEENPPTYVQTIEPNDGNELEVDGDQVTSEVQEVDVGRFRVGDAEYFFVIYDEEHLLLGDVPHTDTVLGTTDFRSGEDMNYTLEEDFGSETGVTGVDRIESQDLVSFNADSEDWDGQRLLEGGNENFEDLDIDEGDIDAEVREYNLYIEPGDEGYILRTRFNVEQDTPEDGTTDLFPSEGQEYIFDAEDDDEAALQPGQNFPIDVGIQVPMGVDQEGINPGTVTILSETFEDDGGD